MALSSLINYIIKKIYAVYLLLPVLKLYGNDALKMTRTRPREIKCDLNYLISGSEGARASNTDLQRAREVYEPWKKESQDHFWHLENLETCNIQAKRY